MLDRIFARLAWYHGRQGRVKSAASLSSGRSDHRWASEINARIGRQTRAQDQLDWSVKFCGNMLAEEGNNA
jgi:hypothetical protein